MVGNRKNLSIEAVNSIKEKLCKFSKKERWRICELYKTKSASEIAKMYKVGCQTIQNSLRLENKKIRGIKEAQQLYLQTHTERSEKQSIFMKKHNPMDNPLSRKKCSQPGKLNANWNGGKKTVICEMCGATRKMSNARYKKLVLKGLCWNCYKHSNPKSSIEIAMANELTRRNILYEEQVPFHGMFLDFYIPKMNIAVECDGEYWHSLPENKKRDMKKNKLLLKEGYIVFRFTDKQIKQDVSSCVNKIIKK